MWKSVVNLWAITWKQDKPLFWMEFIGAFTAMLGASIITFGAPYPNLTFAFWSYLISSVVMVITAYKRENGWLFVLMCFYTMTTTVGLINVYSV